VSTFDAVAARLAAFSAAGWQVAVAEE